MTEETQNSAQEAEQADEVQETENSQETPEGQAQPDSVDQLPDWAKKLITELRGENAKHRKAKQAAEKEAQKVAETAAAEQGKFKELWEQTKTQLEKEQARVQAAELAMLRTKIASKHKLPAELAERLQGETEEELELDAQKLVSLIPKPAAVTDAGNGMNTQQPTPQKSDDDIKEMAARLGVSFKHLKNHLMKE